MLKFEDELEAAANKDVTSDPVDVEAEAVPVDPVHTGVSEPVPTQDTPTGAAARMLERAAVTAEELIVHAQAEADAIRETSRREAREVAAELSRTKAEQVAELGRERATTLTGLAEEKATLESKLATLRSLASEHRDQMRRHLTHQLELIELMRAVPETPVAEVS